MSKTKGETYIIRMFVKVIILVNQVTQACAQRNLFEMQTCRLRPKTAVVKPQGKQASGLGLSVLVLVILGDFPSSQPTLELPRYNTGFFASKENMKNQSHSSKKHPEAPTHLATPQSW